MAVCVHRPLPIVINVHDDGRYRVYGTVERQGAPNTPLARRVELWNQQEKRMVRETWSDGVTGAWNFERVRGGPGVTYAAVAYDHLGQHQAVIVAAIEPEVMT